MVKPFYLVVKNGELKINKNLIAKSKSNTSENAEN
jgi:hypothetical protein